MCQSSRHILCAVRRRPSQATAVRRWPPQATAHGMCLLLFGMCLLLYGEPIYHAASRPKMDYILVMEMPRYRCSPIQLILGITLFLSVSPCFGDGTSDSIGDRLDGKTIAERRIALLKFVAAYQPTAREENDPKISAAAYAARFVLNVDVDYANQRLDSAVDSRIALAEKGNGKTYGPDSSEKTALDPFDKAALVNTYFLGKDKIPRAVSDKIRRYVSFWKHKIWTGYGAINYRLMQDGSGFLAAEEWPELEDADGLNAMEIKRVTRERLHGYFDEICKKNCSEYGCPIYSAVNLSAVKMLAEFSRDEDLRNRATLTLDAMMLDIACSWNRGVNIGTASRAKNWDSTDTGLENMGATAAAAWVWFGAPRSISSSGIGWSHSFWMATPGRYQVPELIINLANNRDEPSVYQGSIVALKGMNVRRTTYHSTHYGLCSQWDHPKAPTAALYKESRRNMLKWLSEKPSSTFAVCMENPRRPYALQENVANPLGYGENPFSQVLQNTGTMVGIYNVPEDYPYYKMYVPFTTRGAIVKRIEGSGWVFCHNGSMLMAFRSIKPYTWDTTKWNECDLLWCNARKNGWIVETSELSAFAGGGVDLELSKFADSILAKTAIVETEIDLANPKLTYRSLNGTTLELTYLPHRAKYSDQCRIDGKSVDYESWPLHRSDWVEQAIDGTVLKIQAGRKSLKFDFDNWTKLELQ